MTFPRQNYVADPRPLRPVDFRTFEDAADHGQPAERPRWHLRPDLVAPPDDFRIIVDTREQAPFFVRKPYAQRGTLKTGDYSLLGHEAEITLERKSLEDAYGSYSRGRERFEREHERFAEFKSKAILIEATYAQVLDPEQQDHAKQLLAGVLERLEDDLNPDADVLRQVLQELGWWSGRPEWRSQVRPQSVEGSLMSWAHRYGVQVLFAGSHRLAERMAFRWLATWYLEQGDEK